MKKFTDEQIIIALESSKEAAETDEVRDFLDDVIECINRKNAEIEQWKEEADRWQNAFCKVNEDMSTIKFEAIKEFAERVETLVLPLLLPATLEERDMVYRCLTIIDNLVKEMTEVEK